MRLFHTSWMLEQIGDSLIPTSFINGPKFEFRAGVYFWETEEFARIRMPSGFQAVIYETDSKSLRDLELVRDNIWKTPHPVPFSLLREIHRQEGREPPRLREYLEGKLKGS